MKYGSAEFWMSSLVEYARWKVSVTEICERNLGKRVWGTNYGRKMGKGICGSYSMCISSKTIIFVKLK